jgi:hypothetical protein
VYTVHGNVLGGSLMQIRETGALGDASRGMDTNICLLKNPRLRRQMPSLIRPWWPHTLHPWAQKDIFFL